MVRLVDGDRAAFDPLFAALHPRAVALARMRLDASDADDAAQQTLVRVFARAHEFTPGRPVLPWFYAIAANEIHGLARGRARGAARCATLDAADHVAGGADPEAALVDAELRASLRAAIGALDDASASAVRALLGEEARAGVEPAAFRKRVSRAYARLRVILGGRT